MSTKNKLNSKLPEKLQQTKDVDSNSHCHN